MSKGKIYIEIPRSKVNDTEIEENLDFNRNLSKDNLSLVSIIIPLYNEENSIKNVLTRIPNHHKYEIILVDDGSTDSSMEKAKEIKNRTIKIVKHEENQGYGATILTGVKHAIGNIIVTMDSDGQHNPEEIPFLINPIINKCADIVIGSRYLGKSKYKIPLYVRVGEKFIGISLRLLYHSRIGNNQSGFRAFSRYSLKIFKDMRYTKFGLCTETLFKAASNDLKIVEIPISINARKYGQSHVNLIKIVRSILTCIMIYGLKRFRILNLISKLILEEIKNKLN